MFLLGRGTHHLVVEGRGRMQSGERARVSAQVSAHPPTRGGQARAGPAREPTRSAGPSEGDP